jgi:CheY-like chemotaxis protein
MDRHAGGLGLGLAIVKTLVQLHGGRVNVESEGLGRGARFTVHLPLALEAVHDAAPPAPALPGSERAGRVLLVDDNDDAAEMLRLLLESQGHEVCCVSDGPAALAAIDHFAPDVALLDIGLPGMDGYELAARLRADPRLAELKMVALTGYGAEQDRARALATHFSEHLVKPVSGERLLAVLSQLMSERFEKA